MGGRGSGWARERKTTVEAGLILDIKKLVAMGALVPGAYRRGSLTCGCDSSEFEYESELRHAPPCPITAADVGGSSVRLRKSAFRSCICRPEPPSSPAGRLTISPIAPFKKAAGENDQKSFGAAWPSDSPVTLNSGWLPWDNPHGRLLASVRAAMNKAEIIAGTFQTRRSAKNGRLLLRWRDRALHAF
jgi:hypothetical protein